MRNRPAPEVVANATRLAVPPPTPPKRREPSDTVVIPVPPPPTARVPERDGVNVWVSELPMIVIADVKPLKTEVEVARVWVPPVWVCPTGPNAVMPDPAVERVVPVKVRPLPTVRVLMGEVPFPMRIPVRVVEPVPPAPTLMFKDEVATHDGLPVV